ncbi:MAG: hypothetical protein NVS4B3_01630 [Gemmatimonadaceae bacterium]
MHVNRPHLSIDRIITAAAALLIAALGFLPIARWIPGNRSAPSYAADVADWTNGALICFGVGIILAIVSRRLPALWRPGLAGEVARTVGDRPRPAGLVLGAATLALYVAISFRVFDARPLLIDEIVQLFQARIYAAGHLTAPLAPHPEFFGNLHMVERGGRVFAQFPPGHSVLLALGDLAHASWLVTPLCGVLAAVLFARLARAVEPRPTVALSATLLFAFAPFMAFMAGSYMNHVPALAFIVAGLVALERVSRSHRAAPGAALLMGLAFGAAASIRPVDAFAFAFPAALWLLARALRTPAMWRDVAAAGVGVLTPMLPVMWVNAETTGAPLLFGYEMLWGKSHNLGFHAAPWGTAHTPAHGLLLTSLYFLRLQRYLFETPLPSLLPVVTALALTRRLSAFDRYLAAASALVVGLYFAYWHDGFYLGPRFMLPLMPALALWSARSLGPIVDRLGAGSLGHRTVIYAVIVALLLSVTAEIPIRAKQYHGGFQTLRWNADSAAEQAGVRRALVLVRESWGAERIARMWALGLSRGETEYLFPRSDACKMDRVLDSLERAGAPARPPYAALATLVADSGQIVTNIGTVGERILPGSPYTPHCAGRVTDDEHGVTLHLPLVLAQWGGNIYARDLHARDTLLLTDYPGRPLWVLRPTSSRLGEPPRFVRASLDSLHAAWREGR